MLRNASPSRRTRLPSYRSRSRPCRHCLQTRLRLRRHSLVLRGCFRVPNVRGDGGGEWIGRASNRDACPRPHRPRRRAGPRAGYTPLATSQAGRGSDRRLGGRPPDRRNASARVNCAKGVLRLARAPRAVASKPAPVSNGRRDSATSGPHCRRLDCHRRGGHCSWSVEPDREQARVLERASHSACRSGATHSSALARRKARAALAPRPPRGRRSISRSTSRSSR